MPGVRGEGFLEDVRRLLQQALEADEVAQPRRKRGDRRRPVARELPSSSSRFAMLGRTTSRPPRIAAWSACTSAGSARSSSSL